MMKGLRGGQYKPLTDADIQTLHEAAHRRCSRKPGFTYESGLADTAAHARGGRRPGGPRRRPASASRETSLADGAGRQGSAAGDPLQPRRQKRSGPDRPSRLYGHRAVQRSRSSTSKPAKVAPAPFRTYTSWPDWSTAWSTCTSTCAPAFPPIFLKSAYDVNIYYACLHATGKHVMAGVNDVEGFYRVLDLASLVAGGREALIAQRPFISVITSLCHQPSEAVHSIHAASCGKPSAITFPWRFQQPPCRGRLPPSPWPGPWLNCMPNKWPASASAS